MSKSDIKRMATVSPLDAADRIIKLEATLAQAIEALEQINAHGCCIMHNGETCPGCISSQALEKLKYNPR